MSVGLPPHLAALATARAYPHPVDSVEVIETHISWVLLAGEFAYKIKRPVRYAFIDLREPAHRKHLCEEEVRLNRRFAPELYVDVCEVVSVGGQARIGGHGMVLEHAVRMRRFGRDEELDRLLDTRRVAPSELEAFGRELALIHAHLPATTRAARWGQPVEIQSLIIRNLIECAQAARVFGTEAEVRALQVPLESRLPPVAAWMAARRASGRVRECHGDLHSRNVVRLGGRLVAFDCIEFEPAFRWIDVAEEVAVLSSDLAARDRPLHAHAFRGGYLAQSGDYNLCRLLRLYEAHRALVRAKVAALSAADVSSALEREPLLQEHLRLLAHASAAVRSWGAKPPLILMSGLSGSGKTWLARPLAERLGAIHLRSDVERKRAAGLGERSQTHSALGGGLYARAASEAVYEDLARGAEDVIVGGYGAIVDAAFLQRAQRAPFLALARRLNVKLWLVSCDAPVGVLRARIAQRRRSGRDASEADQAVLEWQMAHREPVQPQEGIDAIEVSTAEPHALDQVLGAIRGSARA
ncbi:MAG TPA: AAA family ATPase [Steroidobacteraceae bacterium]|nr:AAA family ATPase [Steroidobacteraceae bacterium]